MDAALLVREARRRAGLTQQALAERVGTTQSAVARLERGAISPTVSTLDQLLRGCDYEAAVVLRPKVDEGEWSQVSHNRTLSPEQRLMQLTQLARFARVGQAAMRKAKAGRHGRR